MHAWPARTQPALPQLVVGFTTSRLLAGGITPDAEAPAQGSKDNRLPPLFCLATQDAGKYAPSAHLRLVVEP